MSNVSNSEIRKASSSNLAFFKVLAVLDGTLQASDYSQLLSEIGVPFKMVVGSEEALQILETERFDVVLLEILEASASGDQALKAVRNSNGSFRNIPVIAIGDDKSIASAAIQSQVQDAVLKSAGVAGLKATLQKWADKVFESLPVLAESSIEKIRIFDDEEQTLLTSLFQIYSESTAVEIEELKELVQKQDFDLLRKKAHKLKSSAAQLGAFRFEKYCSLMEYEPMLTQARAAELYEQMMTEYQNSVAEFERYRQKHASV